MVPVECPDRDYKTKFKLAALSAALAATAFAAALAAPPPQEAHAGAADDLRGNC